MRPVRCSVLTLGGGCPQSPFTLLSPAMRGESSVTAFTALVHSSRRLNLSTQTIERRAPTVIGR